MPNRILWESICTSESVEELPPSCEVFFYRLLVHCDDYGRMDARPAVLRSRCFPLRRRVGDRNIVEWLSLLESAGMLYRFENDGKPFLQMTNWPIYQRVRNQRPKYPSPDDSGSRLLAADGRGLPPRVRVGLDSDSDSDSDSGGVQGGDGFEDFWAGYPAPRRQGKGDARKAWGRALDRACAEDVLAGLVRFADDPNLPLDEPKFIPLPATWLNQDRWEDGPLPSRNGRAKRDAAAETFARAKALAERGM